MSVVGCLVVSMEGIDGTEAGIAPDSPGEPTLAQMYDTLAGLVEGLVGLDATAATLSAARTELVETIRRWSAIIESTVENSTPKSRELAFRSVRAEVACALRLPERSVEGLFGEARYLVSSLPETMQAMRSGEISYRHAKVIIDHAAPLSADDLPAFERLIVPAAATSSVATLKRRARLLREQLDPSTIAERTRTAFEKREVTWSPDDDGMGWLALYLSAADGAAAYSRATDVALKLRDDERAAAAAALADGAPAITPRTLAQLRLDVMRDALLCGTFDALGGKLVRPDVFVTVPVFSLMGLTEEPAILDGYGPIDAETARRLAANAPSFVRLLVHPHTGVVLGVDRDRYALPADLQNAVRVRYSTCGMFGCNLPAERCDVDHTFDWNYGGKTELKNLAPLCRGHHTVKHHTPWTVKQAPDGTGVLTWTSPAGRNYVNEPENRARPPEIPPF